MITVYVGNDQRSLEDADEHWITQQVNRRRADELPVCVRIEIRVDGANLTLATPACQSFGGGGRPPNVLERRIFDLWEKLHLNMLNFSAGNVVAFLKQLSRFV
jgi:hypothetical protein